MEFDDITVMIPAVILTTTTMEPRFPEAYIDAGAGLDRLEDIGALAFDNWLLTTTKGTTEYTPLIAVILDIDRHHWSLEEKWRIICELTLRGVDLPLLSSADVEALQKTMELPAVVVGGAR